MTAPNLDGYDSGREKKPRYGKTKHLPTELVFGEFDSFGVMNGWLKSYIGGDDWANSGIDNFLNTDRTHNLDRDLLKSLGVDGSVPLSEARKRIKKNAANDNHESQDATEEAA